MKTTSISDSFACGVCGGDRVVLAKILPAEHPADSFGVSTNTFFVVLIKYPFLTAGPHQEHTVLEVTSMISYSDNRGCIFRSNLGLITIVKETHTSIVLR